MGSFCIDFHQLNQKSLGPYQLVVAVDAESEQGRGEDDDGGLSDGVVQPVAVACQDPGFAQPTHTIWFSQSPAMRQCKDRIYAYTK